MGDDSLFDTPLERHGTDCVKWDYPAMFSGNDEEAIPAWIAEMDFAAPPAVQKALSVRASHPIYGYTWKSPGFFKAVSSWFSKFGWQVPSNWISTSPGVMHTISTAIKIYSDPGDTIITDSPIYPPIHQCINNLGRHVLFNKLTLQNGRYVRDFTAISRGITSNTKMYIICNPHNPTGRVWTKGELIELGQFCLHHKLIIISDEVYADLVFDGAHTCIASLDNGFEQSSVTCSSPGKTYCLSGLAIANVVIPNKKLRNMFVREKEFSHLSLPDPFALIATQEAYLYAHDWLKRLRRYLRINRDLSMKYLREGEPAIVPVSSEGSFLLWLDCRELHHNSETLKDHFLHSAKVLVSEGSHYGPGGEGFVRIHFGFSRLILLEMLRRIVSSR